MKNTKTLMTLAFLTSVSPLAPSLLHAQDAGALLDALVSEGVIKQSKAEDIRAKLSADYKKTSAGKLQFDGAVKEIKFYGDARFRYQWDESRAQGAGGSSLDSSRNQQRERIRLRLGVDAKLGDDFFAGFQLATGQTADSDNQTVGASGAGAGFGKFPIYISKAFLGWEPVKGLTGVLGKQTNPFYFHDQGLVWDADINPVGLSEKVELHKLLGWVGPWELSLQAGQFVFADNNEGYVAGKNGTDKANDALLFEAQAVLAYKYDDRNKVTIAPGFLTYNAASLSTTGSINGTATTTGAVTGANAIPFVADNGTRGLQLLLLPGDYTTKIAGVKTKVLWDLSYNLDGKTRAYDVYGLLANDDPKASAKNTRSSRDDLAWLVGVVLGENKKKGDLSFLANYRETGLTAVDPNLNDSDYALSKLNTKGFKVGASYNLSNSVVLTLTYQNAFNLRRELQSDAAGNDAWKVAAAKSLADRNNVQIFQADVTVKF